ncbi:type I methionyl aminopeptidase [Mechercharimyces sp. CAU 1602]|uniref:type I methionyl aminopeptidase n=1 Tax=Mechercharimyces sp. CAU 1602 TaxID=2973933 RepID=UPI0021622FEF|nr:type I methionyl aminopeptidase [Mechercharimyces sp. CAU 1602]MCS1352577.1 type I methionyl aminopeptidase [Mechercharimyces sp. CAU 1602]
MIILKSANELERMRASGRLVFEAHQRVKEAIRPGVTTRELDRIVEEFLRKHGATSSFKGYNGFKGHVCASVNEELVHGIPGSRVLQDGDIITIDIGAFYQGYHGDSAWTYPVGSIPEKTQHLLDVTKESLYRGIREAKPNARLGDISHAVQSYVEEEGYSIVREYAGHGIGQTLHEDPSIPNYGPPGRGPRLKQRMTLAIEPMVNAGLRHVKTLADDWTVVTRDGSLCAHFEHTIAITDDGYEILTGHDTV